MGCGSSQPAVQEAAGSSNGVPSHTGSSHKSQGSGQLQPKGSRGAKWPSVRVSEDEVPEYPHSEIKLMTSNFNTKVGEGGFGIVYKGFLVDPTSPNGQLVVAVKMLAELSHQGPEEFMTEVRTMGSLSHPRILRLVGCSTDKCRALIYEYIPHGDVHMYLKKAREGQVQFPFDARLRVALGCAEALVIIHAKGFIHRDFKASNVLLKENFYSILADFGLVRTIEDFETHVSTRVMGSAGYLDPVYFEEGHLSPMCDVFSFGVFLLELLCGLSVEEKQFEVFRDYLSVPEESEGRPQMEEDEIVAPQLKDSLSKAALQSYLALLRRCLADDWDARDNMENVYCKLKEIMQGEGIL